MHATRAPAATTLAVTLALAAVAAAVLSGAPFSGAMSHDREITVGSAIPTLAWFLAGWTLMLLAMMLPTATTLLAGVGRLAPSPWGSIRLRAATSAAYLAVWAAVGYLFRAGDVLVHAAVDRLSWIEERPRLVGAAVLLLGGAFQFSALKHRCLTACRTPLSFVYRHWRGGNPYGDAARIGVAYGLSCAGCCWALMLVMFAFGAMSLAWMLVFGAAMAIERNSRVGRHLSAPLGIGLIVAGLVVAGWATIGPGSPT